ncbi:hypothetical protein H072_3481 [Dactylellina haptotyla CBS 200.50]|uniref:Uncharacterized protein n=1 Tax=Dactylellina haptotyla (strain CBS 200.50) TaxID=1284197 RepID=S8BSS7_DACHA|nr:hypothetical protein H072_3481 [Dactylellina haptotyla CBS 200.50]
MSSSKSPLFSVIAPPSTDIWRKPPATNRFNAPTARLGSKPLKLFKRARITFSLPPRSELVKYDQGGLLLAVKRHGQPTTEAQWIKTGIEYYLDKPWVGTVCCDKWADWSITPLGEDMECPTATIEAERSNDELGKSLWIYLVRGEKRIPLREVNFIFADEEGDTVNGPVYVDVGAYAARPLKKEGDEAEELEVKIWDVEVEWREETLDLQQVRLMHAEYPSRATTQLPTKRSVPLAGLASLERSESVIDSGTTPRSWSAGSKNSVEDRYLADASLPVTYQRARRPQIHTPSTVWRTTHVNVRSPANRNLTSNIPPAFAACPSDTTSAPFAALVITDDDDDDDDDDAWLLLLCYLIPRPTVRRR